MDPFTIGLATAGAGALAGSMGDKTTVSTNTGPAGALERQASGISSSMFSQLSGSVGAGAGQADVAAGLAGSRGLAAMLESYSKGNFLPTASDFATASQFTNEAFKPQQLAINQQFEGEQQRAAQLASQLGREVNDPIIQAKLSQERMRAQERLGADQSAYGAQFALGLPQQRLGYMSQMADVKNSLASQAMSNRQALLGLGMQQQQIGQQFRLGTASRTQSSGGGMQGAIMGGLAGFGAGAGAASGMNQLLNGFSSQTSLSAPQQGFSAPQSYPMMQSFSAPQQSQPQAMDGTKQSNPFPAFAAPTAKSSMPSWDMYGNRTK